MEELIKLFLSLTKEEKKQVIEYLNRREDEKED